MNAWNFSALLAVALLCQPAVARCPTDGMKSFEGTFTGVLAPLDMQGERKPLSLMTETQAISDCTHFTVDIHYVDPATRAETRRVTFSAAWDDGTNLFYLAGPDFKGTFRTLRPTQYLLSFETKFQGTAAHCDEMISVTDGGTQIMRSVQCFQGGLGGPAIGTRSALGTRSKLGARDTFNIRP